MAQEIGFLHTIAPHVVLDSESKSALFSRMQRRELPKGFVLVAMGQICRSVYFIEKGLSRSYYLKDGKEITEAFCAENTFACSINSYLTGSPDMRQRELLEDSVVWSLPYPQLEALYQQYHAIERLGRHIITLELSAMHKRLEALQFMTAQERYKALLQSQPSIIRRVPLGLIASYLGITQETLSRIRAEVGSF